MTEAEWLSTDDSIRMNNQMRSASDRKLRLVACALTRSIWDQLSALGKQAVVVAEGFADGDETTRTRLSYWSRLLNAKTRRTQTAIWLPYCCLEACGWYAAELGIGSDGIPRSFEADILRDIFGNPFRPVAFDPAWRTGHTVDIAGKMYDEREFAAMPILADALEEAGCDSHDILTHCREPGVHVRGCWVVDLVLGKE